MSSAGCSGAKFAAQERTLPAADKIIIDTTHAHCPQKQDGWDLIAKRYKLCWENAEADKRASRRQYVNAATYYATAGKGATK